MYIDTYACIYIHIYMRAHTHTHMGGGRERDLFEEIGTGSSNFGSWQVQNLQDRPTGWTQERVHIAVLTPTAAWR